MKPTDEIKEWELTYNFLIGEASGLESYSLLLRHAAGDLYAQRKDTEARIYRELADDAKARSVRKRMEADKHKVRYDKDDQNKE